MVHKKKALFSLAVFVLIAALLCGCGAKKVEDTPEAQDETTVESIGELDQENQEQPEETPEPTPEPKRFNVPTTVYEDEKFAITIIDINTGTETKNAFGLMFSIIDKMEKRAINLTPDISAKCDGEDVVNPELYTELGGRWLGYDGLVWAYPGMAGSAYINLGMLKDKVDEMTPDTTLEITMKIDTYPPVEEGKTRSPIDEEIEFSFKFNPFSPPLK